MHVTDVIEVLTAKPGVTRNDLKIDRGLLKNPVTEKNQHVTRIELSQSDYHLEIHFTPRVPPFEEDEDVVVSKIEYMQQNMSYDAFRNAVIKKYGPPSAANHWCTGRIKKRYKNFKPCIGSNGPFLYVWSSSLSLQDDRFSLNLKSYLDKTTETNF